MATWRLPSGRKSEEQFRLFIYLIMKYILFVLGLFLSINVHAFTALSPEGVEIQFKIINDNEVQVGYQSINTLTSGSLTIPATVVYNKKSYKVTSIGYRAFLRCCSLTSITIPEGVTSIEKSAFLNCDSLHSINIPNSVKHIGIDAFWGCHNLSKVNFESIESFLNIEYEVSPYTQPGRAAYSNPLSHSGHLYVKGEEVTDVVIPDDVTEIRPYAFGNCSNLTSISIPNSVKSIGNYAFWGCDSLAKVDFASMELLFSIEYGEYGSPFINYKHRKSLYIKGEEVTNIVVPNGVTRIIPYAFNTCGNLTSVIIPNTVTSIGEWAFGYCI